jgi:hypothetical protein
MTMDIACGRQAEIETRRRISMLAREDRDTSKAGGEVPERARKPRKA